MMIEKLTPKAFLDAFILEQIESQPLANRILLYRSFAAQTQDASLRKSCLSLAADLEDIERRHQQLLLDFKRSAL